jgi:hypothetical protein
MLVKLTFGTGRPCLLFGKEDTTINERGSLKANGTKIRPLFEKDIGLFERF